MMLSTTRGPTARGHEVQGRWRRGTRTTIVARWAAAWGEAAALSSLSEIPGPLPLDPLTVVDDSTYLPTLGAQGDLPSGFFRELSALYA